MNTRASKKVCVSERALNRLGRYANFALSLLRRFLINLKNKKCALREKCPSRQILNHGIKLAEKDLKVSSIAGSESSELSL